jgi:mono/diheme cytochrome c family protein
MTKNVYLKSFCIIASMLFLGVIATTVTAHEWMAPKDAAKRQNPIAETAESVQHGKKLFLNNCAYCHGENAKGMSASDAGLKKSPPNLIKRLSNHTDGDFFWKIQHGRNEMPAFKDTLQNNDIWDIINFIKSS